MDADLKGQLDRLYEDTKAGKINIEIGNGKRLWADFLGKLSDCGTDQDMKEAEKMFYEVAVPEKQKLYDKDVGGSLGLTAAVFTLMNASVADHVSQWYEHRLYKKTVMKKLGLYLRPKLLQYV